MVKVIYTDPSGKQTDITYAQEVSFELYGDATPELRAMLRAWEDQRKRAKAITSPELQIPRHFLENV